MAHISLSQFGAVLDMARRQRGHYLADAAQALGIGKKTLVDARKYPVLHNPRPALLAVLGRYVGWTADEVRAAMAIPEAPIAATYLRMTRVGIQYGPAIPQKGVSCSDCEYYSACRRQVFAGNGFAICEDLIPADVLPTSVAAIVMQNHLSGTGD